MSAETESSQSPLLEDENDAAEIDWLSKEEERALLDALLRGHDGGIELKVAEREFAQVLDWAEGIRIGEAMLRALLEGAAGIRVNEESGALEFRLSDPEPEES